MPQFQTSVSNCYRQSGVLAWTLNNEIKTKIKGDKDEENNRGMLMKLHIQSRFKNRNELRVSKILV